MFKKQLYLQWNKSKLFPRVNTRTRMSKMYVVSLPDRSYTYTEFSRRAQLVFYTIMIIINLSLVGVVYSLFFHIESDKSIDIVPVSQLVLYNRVITNFEYIRDNSRLEYISDSDARLLAKSLVYWGDYFGLSQDYLLAVGHQESHFNKHAISSSNAMGFFQVIPKYHFDSIKESVIKTGKKDIFDPEVQAYLVCKILSSYRKSSGSMDGALMRYYGGVTRGSNEDYKRKINIRRKNAETFINSRMLSNVVI